MIDLVQDAYVLTVDGYRVGSFKSYDEAFQVWNELVNHSLAA